MTVYLTAAAPKFFYIPSASMLPTLLPGDSVVVRSTQARCIRRLPEFLCAILGEPGPGDVIVFRAFVDNAPNYVVKRIVGLPGDTVALHAGILAVNGVSVHRTSTAPYRYHRSDRREVMQIAQFHETLPTGRSYYSLSGYFPEPPEPAPDLNERPPTVVPAGHYFVLGDDRDHSFDSRMSPQEGGVGFVAATDVVGIASFVIFSREPPPTSAPRGRAIRLDRIFREID